MGRQSFGKVLICSVLIMFPIDSVRSTDNRARASPESDGPSKQHNYQSKVMTEKSHLKSNSGDEKRQSKLVQLRKDHVAALGKVKNNFQLNISAKNLEEAIEQADRKTLEEWYSYAFGLNDIIKKVEGAARRCGCTAMYEPILDSKNRLNHGMSAVSNKLRYGKVHVNK